MMRRAQRFIAENWPLRIWIAGAVVAWLTVLMFALAPDRSLLLNPTELATFVGIAIAGLIVSILTAGVFAFVFVGPIYRFQAQLNGAPFGPGDEVRILSGRHRGRIAFVYSNWQGETVRVDIGEEAMLKYKDIYGQYQIQRVPPASHEPSVV